MNTTKAKKAAPDSRSVLALDIENREARNSLGT